MSRPPVSTPAGWRAVAVCAAFGAGVCFAVLLHAPLAACAAVLLGGCGVSIMGRGIGMTRTTLLLAVAVAFACACGLARGTQAGTAATAWLSAARSGPTILVGTVRDGTGSRRTAAQVVVDVDRVVRNDGELAVHVGVLATLRSGPPVLPGDQVQLSVKGLRAPGTDTIGAILTREGIDAVAQSPTLTVQAEGGPSPARLLAIARNHLAAAVDAALPEPAASLLDGIAFDIRHPLPSDLTAALQDSGLAHVLAVSGLKVVLVAGLIAAVCGGLGLSPRMRMLITACAVGGYVVLTGASPAAVRAALMAGAGWGLHGTGRVPDPLPLLAATGAAMLALDPGLCRDTGFQLSMLGTLGIVLLASPTAHRLPGPRILREPFAMTLAAQVVTLPVMASAFGVVSLVGPVANALAVPLLPPLILAGAVGAGVAMAVPAAGTVALAAAGGLALLIAGIATRAAAVPMAAWHVAAWPRIYVVAETCAIAAAALVWIAVGRHARSTAGAAHTPTLDAPRPRIVLRSGSRPRISRRGAAALAAVAAIGAGGTVVLAATRPDGLLHVAVLDVGGARAVAIRTATGDTALVDTGSDPQRLLDSLGPALPPLTRTLGLLVLTGGDKGAVGGLTAVGDRYTVERAVVPDQGLGRAARTALAALSDRGTEVTTAPPDATWTWGGTTWRLLSPDGAGDEGTALEVADPTGRAVLLADLTVAAQEELASRRGGALAADLLVAPPTATVATALLDAVRPRYLAVPDAKATTRTSSSLLVGRGVSHTGTAGTLTFIGSEGGLRSP